MAQQETIGVKDAYRDTALSIIIGPLKYIVPLLSYIILYPIIIINSGFDVLGLWSLLLTIVTVFGFTDLGFSQLLLREVGPDLKQDALNESHSNYKASVRFYIGVLCGSILGVTICFGIISRATATVYPSDYLLPSLYLIAIGSTLQLTARLDGAILAAYRYNYIVQLVYALTPIALFIPAIIGAITSRPIEGLAVGIVLSSLSSIVVLRLNMRRVCTSWNNSNTSQSFSGSCRHLRLMLRRGRYLYLSSIGLAIRAPLYKLIISITLGLTATGLFDIALRVTQAIRDFVGAGFLVLYPSFALMHRNKDDSQVVIMMRVSLMLLLLFGGVGLGLLAAFLESIFDIWLGEYPTELLMVAWFLIVWQLSTIINIPFWLLLQATHNERYCAFAVWTHVLALLLVGVILPTTNWGIVGVTGFWIFASISTQLIIYIAIQKLFGTLKKLFCETRMLVVLFCSIVIVVDGVIVSWSGVTGYQFVGLLLIMAFVVGISSVVVGRTLVGMDRKYRW